MTITGAGVVQSVRYQGYGMDTQDLILGRMRPTQNPTQVITWAASFKLHLVPGLSIHGATQYSFKKILVSNWQ